MNEKSPVALALLMCAATLGCKEPNNAVPTPPASAAASTVPQPEASAPPVVSAASANPEPNGFTLAEPVGPPRTYRILRFGDGTAFKPVKDDCETPYIKLADSPNDEWNWIRQAMIANPEFREVETPTKPMEVAFHETGVPNDFKLYATCADGKTCNQLAAMYLQVVWASFPRAFCKAPPEDARPVTLTGGDGLDISEHEHLPKCARLNACATRMDPTNTKIGPECQKAWTKFPLDCARKATCEEVMACFKTEKQP